MNHDIQVPERHECDVLVIGGGPAGSTVSPFFVEKGHRVVLLAFKALYHAADITQPRRAFAALARTP